MQKKFTLHTYDIQDLIIAMIMRDKDHEPDGMTERIKRLEDLFADVNNLCCLANDYTVTVTVDDNLRRVDQ